MRNMIIGCLLAMLAAGCTEPDHSGMYQEIRSTDKLVLASMAVSKTARLESSEWYTVGKRIAVYSYDTYMRAYIDMSALEADDLVYDEENRSVHVTLPAVQTELAGRDMEMRKVYENIGLLRSDLDSRERAAMKEKANASLRDEVENNPEFRRQLTEAAQRKARTYFEELFEAQGYRATVDFKNQER